MHFYFFLLYIAAFFGHRKARLLVRGQRETIHILNNSPKHRLDKWRGCVWVHAASVGEFEQARPIIERLRAEHPCEAAGAGQRGQPPGGRDDGSLWPKNAGEAEKADE